MVIYNHKCYITLSLGDNAISFLTVVTVSDLTIYKLHLRMLQSFYDLKLFYDIYQDGTKVINLYGRNLQL